MAIIIELFGIPGAGKSTFRTRLIEKLQPVNIEVADPVPPMGARGRLPRQLRSVVKTMRRVGLIMHNRRLLWWCMKVLRRSPRPFRQKTTAFRLMVVTLERYKAYQSDLSNRVYIVAEGPLQRLFLLLVEHDGARAEVDRSVYMEAAPFGDLLVHIQVSPQHALARLDGRGRHLPPRLLNLDDHQAQLCLAQGDALLVRAAAEAAAVPVPNRPVRLLTEFHSERDTSGGGHLSAS